MIFLGRKRCGLLKNKMFWHIFSCVLNFKSFCCFQIPRVPNFCQWLSWRPFTGGERQKYKSRFFLGRFVFMLVWMTFCFICFTSTHKQPRNFEPDTNTNFLFLFCNVRKVQTDSCVVGKSPLDAGLHGGKDLSCCDITQIGGDGERWCEFGSCVLCKFCCCLFLCGSHCCLQLHALTQTYHMHSCYRHLGE